ncbi:MAG: hypothetical protein ACKOAR_14520, partial [Bacteroidota bacterium]
EGLLLLNRSLWTLIGLGVFAFTLFRFSFEERSKPGREKEATGATIAPSASPVRSQKSVADGTGWSIRQLISQFRIEVISLTKNVAFIMIAVLGAINMISSMNFVTSQGYGLTAMPVTYNVVELIQGTLYLFVIALITFYSGLIVWKEREAKVHDIYDALPYPDWLPIVSKTIALFVAVMLLLLLGCAAGIVTQLINGFSDLRPEVYVMQLLVSDGLTFLMLILLSIFIHAMANNQYLGYFIFIAVLIVNAFLWQVLDVESNLVKFNGSPSLIYSDMNGFGPFLAAKLSFRLYWLLFGIFLLTGAMAYWVRGREDGFKIRSAMALKRLGSRRTLLIVTFLLWQACGIWLFTDTQVRNTYRTEDEREQAQVDYEKLYKKYESRPLPRTVSRDYRIELFPEKRWLDVACDQWVLNKTESPIDTLYFTLPSSWKASIQLPLSTVVLMDTVHRFAIYSLNSPILPGDSVMIGLSMQYHPAGIENEISNTSIVDNGSFFNNMDLLPQLGYQPSAEIANKNDR